jgi:SAM-dependent methyltransferase
VGEYRPTEYWDRRLSEDPSLRGTGHLSYDERYNRWLYRRKGEVLARALRPFAPGSRALDIGSGVGWVIAQLLAAGAAHVDGVDIAPTSVAHLRERFPGSDIQCHALGSGRLPFADGAYDLVTMMDVAYHITDDELLGSGIADIARVLRDDGALILTDGFGPDVVEPAEHVRFRSLASWRRVAEAAGLELTTTAPLYAWLSRDVEESVLRALPGRVRGAVEYVGERLLPQRAHLRIATFRKVG